MLAAGPARRRGAALPLLLAVPALAASALLPWHAAWLCATAVIIVGGVPHGALDVEIGRTLLRRRLGRAWFPGFAAPYLLLVAIVLVAWRVAPALTLAGFLTASVWHFGVEECGTGSVPALACGGLPIALPVLLHPHATALVLGAIAGLPMDAPPVWLTLASLCWLLPACLWITQAMKRPRELVIPGLVAAAFVVLPPLTAFALYFVCVHAPAHMAALIRHPTRAPRAKSHAAAWRLALPTTVLTVLIGAALWPLHGGPAPVRLLQITLQLLAALTLPHMLLESWLDRRDRTQARPKTAPATLASL